MVAQKFNNYKILFLQLGTECDKFHLKDQLKMSPEECQLFNQNKNL